MVHDKPTAASPSRADAGLAVKRRLFGDKEEAISQLMRDLDPELARWAEEWVFGDVWAGGGMDFRDRLLVAIVALTATGKEAQLRNYLFAALDADLDRSVVTEALKTTAIYVGFPSALNALGVWLDVQRSADRRANA